MKFAYYIIAIILIFSLYTCEKEPGANPLPEWEIYNRDEKGPSASFFTSLYINKHGLWAGTKNEGVFLNSSDTWYQFDSTGIYLNGNSVRFISSYGNLMHVGIKNKGVSRFYFNDLDAITGETILDQEYDEISSLNVFSMFLDDNMDQWYGTDVGISHHTGEFWKINWNSYTVENGLSDNNINNICQDPSKVIWAGTKNGLSFFEGSRWKNIPELEGLTIYKQVFNHSDHKLWCATDSGSFQISKENNSYSTKKYISPLVNDEAVHVVYYDPANSEIILGMKGAILLVNNKGERMMEFPSGYEESICNDILTDPEGSLWIATSEALLKLPDN